MSVHSLTSIYIVPEPSSWGTFPHCSSALRLRMTLSRTTSGIIMIRAAFHKTFSITYLVFHSPPVPKNWSGGLTLSLNLFAEITNCHSSFPDPTQKHHQVMWCGWRWWGLTQFYLNFWAKGGVRTSKTEIYPYSCECVNISQLRMIWDIRLGMWIP